MENMLTNVSIKVNVSNKDILEDDGYIKIYNDVTNELIRTITAQELKSNYQTIEITYTTPVEHVRIETSKLKNDRSLNITHTKKLDTEYIINNYTIGQFNKLNNITTYLEAYVGNTHINGKGGRFQTNSWTAEYMNPFTQIVVENTPTIISTQNNQENLKIKIQPWKNTDSDKKYNRAGWTNNIFLVKIPIGTEIIDFKFSFNLLY